MQAHLATYTSLIDELKASNVKLVNQISSLKESSAEELGAAARQYAQGCLKLQGRIGVLEEQLSGREQAEGSLKRDISAHLATISGLQARLQQEQRSLAEATHQQEHQRALWEAKYVSLGEEFKLEKDQLLQEYSLKVAQQQKESQELVGLVNQVKLQLRSVQEQHDADKQHLAAQHRDVQQQEARLAQAEANKCKEVSDLQIKLEEARSFMAKMENEAHEIWDQNRELTRLLRESDQKVQQLDAESLLLRAKQDRQTEEVAELNRILRNKEEEKDREIRHRLRAEHQLKELNAALTKHTKAPELRALRQLSQETHGLASQVSEMKRLSQLSQSIEHKSLRS